LNPLPATTPGDSDGYVDVLSQEEENVLASVRNAVDGMRAKGLLPEPDAVADALGFSCVPKAQGTERLEAEYRANGARFVLRRGAGLPGEIEISFIPETT
jgi:hypothetical protein